MVDAAITWAMHSPLQCVAVLVGLSVAVGLILVPGLHALSEHGHPRC